MGTGDNRGVQARNARRALHFDRSRDFVEWRAGMIVVDAGEAVNLDVDPAGRDLAIDGRIRAFNAFDHAIADVYVDGLARRGMFAADHHLSNSHYRPKRHTLVTVTYSLQSVIRLGDRSPSEERICNE